MYIYCIQETEADLFCDNTFREGAVIDQSRENSWISFGCNKKKCDAKHINVACKESKRK